MRRGFPTSRGQSLFEWLLIVALICIVAVAVLTVAGRRGQVGFESTRAGPTATPGAASPSPPSSLGE